MYSKRVFLTAEWRHLAILNYVVDPAVLKPLLPAGMAGRMSAWLVFVF